MGKKQYISKEQLIKIADAVISVKGTSDYLKYHMAAEYKYTKMNKNTLKDEYTHWYFTGYSIPFLTETSDFYYIKRVKNNLYIMSEPFYDEYGQLNVERFTVNEAVQELLHI